MRKLKKYFLPNWAINKLEEIAKFYETTKTQALLMCIDKGGNFYGKIIYKSKKKTGPAVQSTDHEKNNKPKQENKPQDKEPSHHVTDEELQRELDSLF